MSGAALGLEARDDTKKEEFEQELPIHEDLAGILEAWREEQTVDGVHTPVNGWLFGNLITGRSFWRDLLQTEHLVPAGMASATHIRR